MKKTLGVVMFTMTLWSCNSQSSKTEGNSSTEPLKTELAAENKPTIFIKDSSLYDPAFVKGLKDYNEPLQLIGNYVIAGTDTIWFPEDLPLNKHLEFKATKDHQNYLLSVSRTNLTNLSYSFQLTDEKDKLIDSKSGNAVLGSMFFLASETDNDSETGEVYGSYEYWDNSNDCWFAIRIGHGNTPNGKQRAIVNYGCEDKNKQAFMLEQCPTLRAE